MERYEGEIVGLHVPGSPVPESRFVGPTDECAHPEWWTATDGDSTEVEIADLAWGLVRGLQPEQCVETGGGFGQTTMRIADALVANGHGHLYTLETSPRRARHIEEISRAYPVTVLPFSSMDYSPTTLPLDFVWFDSLYELRVPEFQRYRPWLRPGALVCFHDTAPGHGSHVIESGRDLRAEIEHELGGYLRWLHLPSPRGLTVAQLR